MKIIPPRILLFLQNKTTKRNTLPLLKFFFTLLGIISLYSFLFHIIMLHEGRDFSWITGFYWTLTVMSTLGFGDITFTTDLGLFFTLLVLLSGIVLLLIMLPFSFIQFFYAPWLEAQEKARVPKEINSSIENHIIITNLDPITINLIRKLEKFNYQYVLVVAKMQQALELADAGYSIILGDLDYPETYKRLQIEKAAMVVVTNDDLTNTSISFTIRELTETVPIITNADNEHSIDILEFPGNTQVFEFMKSLGHALARRTLGLNHQASIIGNFDDILIAEAPAIRTALEGKKLADTDIRAKTGITVVGFWERGKYIVPDTQTVIRSSTLLVLAGTASQLALYDKHFAISCASFKPEASVLILGGGRVGCAAAEILKENKVPYKIIEKKEVINEEQKKQHIHGDAANIKTLQRAGIKKSRAIIITTHDDAMNIYLTFYCRQLRPDIQIISRTTNERNISKLHRAGADLVISYASLGANTIFDIIQPDGISSFAEGLNVFSRPVPPALQELTIEKSMIRQKTGCNIIAIHTGNQELITPPPQSTLTKNDTIILIGPIASEQLFDQIFN